MFSEWATSRIGDAADVFDGPHATPEKVSAGPVFLGISNLAEGRLDLSVTEHLSEVDFSRWTKRVTPRVGDIVFSYETRIGQAAAIPAGFRCSLGRRMGLVRPKPDVLNAGFFLYQYLSPEFQELLRRRTIQGSTVDRLALKEFPSFPIALPPLPVQRGIAQILAALDDKIDLNRRMNQTLEAMARALFKDWTLAAHSIGRESVAKLAAEGVLAIGDGYRAKNEELHAPGLPFIRAGQLNNGFNTDGADVLNEASVRLAGEKVSRVGDVAFTSKGTIGRFARVSEHTPRFVYSPQVCFWRSVDAAKLRPSMLYAWMVGADLKGQIDAVAGQTDMALYVSLKDQRAMTMPVFGPQQHVLADTLDQLLDRQSLAVVESRTLASLRDLLLPQLLSGALRIRDAEKQVAEAL